MRSAERVSIAGCAPSAHGAGMPQPFPFLSIQRKPRVRRSLRKLSRGVEARSGRLASRGRRDLPLRAVGGRHRRRGRCERCAAARGARILRRGARCDRARRDPGRPPFPELAEAIREHELPIDLFHALISAFRQDVTTKRYATYADVLDYCARSANPVGRLLLALYRRQGDDNLRWSDAICTGLQLTNFWQDVAIDWQQGTRLPAAGRPRSLRRDTRAHRRRAHGRRVARAHAVRDGAHARAAANRAGRSCVRCRGASASSFRR